MKFQLFLVMMSLMIAGTRVQAAPAPCIEDALPGQMLCRKDATEMLAAMMLQNPKGYNLARSKAKIGMTLDDVRVTFVSEVKTGRESSISTYKYEILLGDCFGTDACEGEYLWTVIETGEGDGYTYSINYKNTVEPTDLIEFPENE